MTPNGGTANVRTPWRDAISLAQQGRNRKKALVVISDGNDTASHVDHPRPQAQISRERGPGVRRRDRRRRRGHYAPRAVSAQPRIPMPIRFHSRECPAAAAGLSPRRSADSGGNQRPAGSTTASTSPRCASDGRQAAGAPRSSADPRIRSGDGRHRRRAEQAVLLAYTSRAEKTAAGHSIRVEVKNRAYRVRSRRGYVAS